MFHLLIFEVNTFLVNMYKKTFSIVLLVHIFCMKAVRFKLNSLESCGYALNDKNYQCKTKKKKSDFDIMHDALSKCCLLWIMIRSSRGETWGGRIFVPFYQWTLFTQSNGFCIIHNRISAVVDIGFHLRSTWITILSTFENNDFDFFLFYFSVFSLLFHLLHYSTFLFSLFCLYWFISSAFIFSPSV